MRLLSRYGAVIVTTMTACLTGSLPSYSQPSAEKAAVAQVLFDEGMKLMGSGQFAAACPKL
jgi:hypothetical protein